MFQINGLIKYVQCYSTACSKPVHHLLLAHALLLAFQQEQAMTWKLASIITRCLLTGISSHMQGGIKGEGVHMSTDVDFTVEKKVWKCGVHIWQRFYMHCSLFISSFLHRSCLNFDTYNLIFPEKDVNMHIQATFNQKLYPFKLKLQWCEWCR